MYTVQLWTETGSFFQMYPHKILVESVWLINKLPCVTLKSVLGQQLFSSELWSPPWIFNLNMPPCCAIKFRFALRMGSWLNSDTVSLVPTCHCEHAVAYSSTMWKFAFDSLQHAAGCCGPPHTSYLGWHQLQPRVYSPSHSFNNQRAVSRPNDKCPH